MYQRWPLSLTGFGDFRSLATNPRVTIVCSSNVSFPWPETVGYNVVFIGVRNNVTKKVISNNVTIVPFLYSTDFQVLVPSSMYCTHCIHTVLHPLILRVCYNTVLLYTNIFQFFTISLQIFPLKSKFIPYLV